VLLRCSYDLRPLFEGPSPETPPVERETILAVRFPAGAASAQIFDLGSAGYDLLAAMDNWTDPAALGDTSEVKELLRDLAQCGLIECSP
jgi:hypothetical protein